MTRDPMFLRALERTCPTCGARPGEPCVMTADADTSPELYSAKKGETRDPHVRRIPLRRYRSRENDVGGAA